MRVFVFFLMMAVALVGVLGGFRLITGRDLIGLSDFGVGRVSATTAAGSTPTPAASPVSAPTSVPTPTVAAPTPTPVPSEGRFMVVANTGGQGVYVRRTPRINDRVRAWVEGSRMQVAGDPVDGDGTRWLKVKAPDGTEGYIPQQYLAPAP